MVPWSGMAQAKARSQEFRLGLAHIGMVPVLGPSSDAFPSALAKGWIGTGAAGTPLAPIWDAAVPSVA